MNWSKTYLVYSPAENNFDNTLCAVNKIISKILDSFSPFNKIWYLIKFMCFFFVNRYLMLIVRDH